MSVPASPRKLWDMDVWPDSTATFYVRGKVVQARWSPSSDPGTGYMIPAFTFPNGYSAVLGPVVGNGRTTAPGEQGAWFAYTVTRASTAEELRSYGILVPDKPGGYRYNEQLKVYCELEEK